MSSGVRNDGGYASGSALGRVDGNSMSSSKPPLAASSYVRCGTVASSSANDFGSRSGWVVALSSLSSAVPDDMQMRFSRGIWLLLLMSSRMSRIRLRRKSRRENQQNLGHRTKGALGSLLIFNGDPLARLDAF